MSDSFVTWWTVAHRAPLSMGFSRQEYWSGLPSPFPGGLKPRDRTWVSCIAGGFFTTELPGKPNYCNLTQTASKVMLKITQARLQQYVNRKLPYVQLVLEKAEEPEIKLPTSAGSWKKQESSRKTSISALLTMPKLLTVWITTNCEKFWKRWEYQTTWPSSWEICMQVRNQQF